MATETLPVTICDLYLYSYFYIKLVKSELFEARKTRCVVAVASPLGRATATSTESMDEKKANVKNQQDENAIFYVRTNFTYFISY